MEGYICIVCIWKDLVGVGNYRIQSSKIRSATWATNAIVRDVVRARQLNSQSSFCFRRLAQINDFLFAIFYVIVVRVHHINIMTPKLVFLTNFSFSDKLYSVLLLTVYLSGAFTEV